MRSWILPIYLFSASLAAAAPPELPAELRAVYQELDARLGEIREDFVEMESSLEALDQLRRRGDPRVSDFSLRCAAGYHRAADSLGDAFPPLLALLHRDPRPIRGEIAPVVLGLLASIGAADTWNRVLALTGGHRATVRTQLTHADPEVREAADREARRMGRLAEEAFRALRRAYRIGIKAVVRLHDLNGRTRARLPPRADSD